MTKRDATKLSKTELKRIAQRLGIVVCADFTRKDIWDALCDRLGEDKVAWGLAAQYVCD